MWVGGEQSIDSDILHLTNLMSLPSLMATTGPGPTVKAPEGECGLGSWGVASTACHPP